MSPLIILPAALCAYSGFYVMCGVGTRLGSRMLRRVWTRDDQKHLNLLSVVFAFSLAFTLHFAGVRF